MGTVATYCDRARAKLGDTNRSKFRDPEVLGVLNDILETIYQTLVNISSNLVYAVGTISTTADTAEYTPSFSFDGFLREGSWVDGEDIYLVQVSEADKIRWDYSSSTSQPEAFYITEDGKIGYLWVPDDTYTIHHTYWKPLTAITNYTANDLPWNGIWSRAIERLLIIELSGIEGVDSSKHNAMAKAEWNKALTMTYTRGIRREKIVSGMFSIEGI